MTLINLNMPRVAARANWGRWVVDCPRCPSAIKVRTWTGGTTCWECGTQSEVVWPDAAEDIIRLLMFRPNPATRNWEPGETLHDLLAENVAHGIWTGEPGQALAIVGDRIVTDELPASRALLSIGA